MAYCKKCGAYIPDGLSACLACGYDEAAADNQNAAAAAREQENEDFRKKYEEERRRRQEDNRKWAEQERLRRQEEEERRRREQEERLKQQAEERARKQEEREARARSFAYRAVGTGTTGAGKNRILAALSYLSILWILPRFLCADDPFARYHARQGLTLFVFSIICDAISAVVPFGGLLNLFRIYCIYKGMSNAFNDRMEPLPYIGQFGEKDE
ncbi:MAG: hypothetical protein IKO83_08790 [Oscillospiraceae bacterium]|nr:hypothetical protein [Oscillospiraceae bacterium]